MSVGRVGYTALVLSTLHRYGLAAIRLLTAALALAGLWGLVRMNRAQTQPVGVDDAAAPQGVWADVLVEAALQPAFWVAAVVAIGATIAVRQLETSVILPSSHNPTHRVKLGVKPGAKGDGESQERPVKQFVKRDLGEAPQALDGVSDAVRTQRNRSRRKLRMEAFLRGEADVRAFTDEMLAAAVEDGASDVHVEPGIPHGLVRFRVRGELREVAKVPQAHQKDLARRLKVMANLVVYQEMAQDGRMTLDTEWGAVDVRVSVVPTGSGEKVVMRLAGDAELLDLGKLGLVPDDMRRVQSLLREPQGLVIATGPTGSGKTTTLYSALAHLKKARPGASLASIEDPIEVEIPFVSQTQVDRARGLDFAGALRSVLRQDPDVLMVGEIRDGETAKIAVQAGLSGHLVLTTLHAESTVGVFPRLVDLGVEPFLAASSTLAALSQRLAPKLCEECRRPVRPSIEQLAILRRAGLVAEGKTFYDADGCPACDYEGRRGRTAVFEILVLGPDLKRQIAAKVPTHELMSAARDLGLVTLLASALSAASRGDVALSDALAFASEVA